MLLPCWQVAEDVGVWRATVLLQCDSRPRPEAQELVSWLWLSCVQASLQFTPEFDGQPKPMSGDCAYLRDRAAASTVAVRI